MVDAVGVYVRYETPDEKGETRRQRNERLDHYTPPFEIPKDGQYIWNWFREISAIASNVSDGFYKPIPPSEYLAWQQLTENIVYPWEYDIMFAMDAVYCDEMNKEIQSRQQARLDRKEREAELNRRR